MIRVLFFLEFGIANFWYVIISVAWLRMLDGVASDCNFIGYGLGGFFIQNTLGLFL